MDSNNQFSLDIGVTLEPKKGKEVWKEIIVDRGSKYTVVVGKIETKEEVKLFLKELVRDSYFRKATHNSYAYRLKESNGLILESKGDDGEQGAGMCILRELKRAEFLNGIVIVTRYFGGVQLHSDRFKHVIDATKQVIEKLKKESV